ncbi:MAG: beta-ketoacyl synthase N-terminal-like domain-containing protein, partial [Acutalibacteraceae bacterium]|nr:beta-ketoacyl synthase N-terminal-like domain-containing protein [Acutalibacteraceae bacterium]
CEKIAITGIGFRLPDANTQEEFWNNLCSGKDSIDKVSEKRRKLSKSAEWQDWLGELRDVDCFDYEFFDLSYDEAIFMDPQHRIAMEVSYEALEDAGVVRDEDNARKVGVYAAICSNTYYPLVLDYVKENGYDNIPPQVMIDNMNNIVAARISHQYNFTGPVMAVDTACSSFSAALHMGRNAIIHNEAEGAVILGANILSTSYMYEFAKKAGIISSTNMSKVFDANADGSILGEGVIVLYIEKLSTAIKNNKNIYGVIHSSAMNNDGFALSITSPNPKGEFSVLEEAYSKSDISPEDISYFEAHGTGTAIGDPIEINALSRLFTKYRDVDNKIAIGSVKTNIGHLLATAGGAGILKVLMCLKNKQLVPSIHMDNINPLLEIDKTPFRVITDTEAWKLNNQSERIAGVSSLGLGGTNTHIILGEYINEEKNDIERNHILTMSAKSMEALEQIKEATLNILNKKDTNINDLCMTRNRYRRHYRYRSACVIDSKGNIIEEISTGQTLKSVSLKTSIYLGDLLENGTEDEFNTLYNKLKIYAAVIKDFGHFYGERSGKIFADLLEEKISIDEAKKLYMSGNSENYGQDDISSEKSFDVLMILGNKAVPNSFTKTKTELKGILLNDNTDVLCNLKSLYVLGTDINWDILYPNGVGRIMNLPAYPFVKNSVWLD